MSEAEDKKKFEEWARKEYGAEWRTITGWADASIIFLAGLKAGREEWGKKTKDIFAIALEQEKEIGVFKDRLQEFHKNLRKLYDTSYVTYGTVLQLFISTFGKEVKTDGKA